MRTSDVNRSQDRNAGQECGWERNPHPSRKIDQHARSWPRARLIPHFVRRFQCDLSHSPSVENPEVSVCRGVENWRPYGTNIRIHAGQKAARSPRRTTSLAELDPPLTCDFGAAKRAPCNIFRKVQGRREGAQTYLKRCGAPDHSSVVRQTGVGVQAPSTSTWSDIISLAGSSRPVAIARHDEGPAPDFVIWSAGPTCCLDTDTVVTYD